MSAWVWLKRSFAEAFKPALSGSWDGGTGLRRAIREDFKLQRYAADQLAKGKRANEDMRAYYASVARLQARMVAAGHWPGEANPRRSAVGGEQP